MALKYQPYSGQILRGDFTGLIGDEMNKFRPVIVISKRPQNSRKTTCIIACLSTTRPKVIQNYHMEVILPTPRPSTLQPSCWLKGDMVYSVSLERLEQYRLGKQDGKRMYYKGCVEHAELFKIRGCVVQALGYPLHV